MSGLSTLARAARAAASAAAASFLGIPLLCFSRQPARFLLCLVCLLGEGDSTMFVALANRNLVRTARRGRPEAYPKDRPNPAGPQGRRRRHPSSPCATARRGRPEAYPKGRPYRQKSDPAPPEIGRGSKRALTHRAGNSYRLT